MQVETTKYEFTSKLSKQLVTDAAKLFWKEQVFKKGLIPFIVLSILWVLGCIYSIWSGQESNSHGAFISCVIGLFLFWACLPFYFWSILRKLQKQSKGLCNHDYKAALTESEIIFTVDSTETRFQWTEINKVFFAPNLIFFLLQSKKWAILPTSERSEPAKKYILERMNLLKPPRLRMKA